MTMMVQLPRDDEKLRSGLEDCGPSMIQLLTFLIQEIRRQTLIQRAMKSTLK